MLFQLAILLVITVPRGESVIIYKNMYNQKTLKVRPQTIRRYESVETAHRCGLRWRNHRTRSPRIVGGTSSYLSQWPWMASLWIKYGVEYVLKCGATLLNEYWAITAAHCVTNVPKFNLLLKFGESDRIHNVNTKRKVIAVEIHPYFNLSHHTYEYDLALLGFNQPLVFRKNILPICIPDKNESFTRRLATVTGWGRLHEDGPMSHQLQHVSVPIMSNKRCEIMWKRAGYSEKIPRVFICAGLPNGGRDSCEGDSGGPLALEDNGKWTLIGVLSWGRGCALPYHPGVYTRITEFTSWIQHTIWK